MRFPHVHPCVDDIVRTSDWFMYITQRRYPSMGSGHTGWYPEIPWPDAPLDAVVKFSTRPCTANLKWIGNTKKEKGNFSQVEFPFANTRVCNDFENASLRLTMETSDEMERHYYKGVSRGFIICYFYFFFCFIHTVRLCTYVQVFVFRNFHSGKPLVRRLTPNTKQSCSRRDFVISPGRQKPNEFWSAQVAKH